MVDAPISPTLCANISKKMDTFSVSSFSFVQPNRFSGESPHYLILNPVMRYIYTLIFLICALLANAKEYKSYSVRCLSSSLPMYKEVEKINTHKGYEQTIYWKKYKKLKIYAFTTVGLGLCGTIVGLIGDVGNNADTNINWKDDGKAWDVVLGIGIGLTVSSIPLFVISHKNKKKAKESVEFSLRGSNVYLDLPNGMKQTRHAVGVCVNF